MATISAKTNKAIEQAIERDCEMCGTKFCSTASIVENGEHYDATFILRESDGTLVQVKCVMETDGYNYFIARAGHPFNTTVIA